MALPPRVHAVLPASRRPRDLAPAIADGLRAVDARLRAAWAGTPADRRLRPRADGGWSVAQVLEHVARTNEAYLPGMSAMANQLEAMPPADVRWRPTFAGRWLAQSLVMRIPLPAPRRIQPGPAPRDEVLDAALASHAAVLALLARVAGRDWRAARMTSPLASVVRPNCGDAFVIILRHSERHAAQVERVAAAAVGAAPE